jgi:DNA-binding NtrC family response regulator
MTGERILIVDDDESMCEFLTIMLEKEGYEIHAVNRGKDAIELAKNNLFHAAMIDIKMPGMDGMTLLGELRSITPGTPVVIMTAFSSEETAIEAVNRGAFYYLVKQAKKDEIRLVIKKALEVGRLQAENKYLKQQLRSRHTSKKIIGKSERIEEVFRLVDKVANCESTVLIYGESGTGKELVAREIHYRSARSEGPFVSINCGALPETLLESELFGHTKGAFTGAVRDKDGLFTVAKRGTFFLDEVGETSPAIQVKLLRVLQEREIIPLGGTKPVKVDVRLIAATNVELEERVREGHFRADLFYRLNVIQIPLPPLRNRRDDIVLLVDFFLNEVSRRAQCGPKTVDAEVMDILVRYDWPGNVRELENVIERAVILQDSDMITREDLPPKIQGLADDTSSCTVEDSRNITLEQLEQRYLAKVLEEVGWRKKVAADILGIDASTLYRKIHRYGLAPQTPEKQSV